MLSDITASIEPIYKQWYVKTYENMMYRDRPAMGMIQKERAGGEQIKQPIKISQGPGQSTSFTNAQTNVGLAVRRPFLGDWGLDYSLARVSGNVAAGSAEHLIEHFAGHDEHVVSRRAAVRKELAHQAVFLAEEILAKVGL